MRPATLLRLALAGSRTDTLRVLLTAFSAALATLVVLTACTVLSIRGFATQYRIQLLVESGLRPGVVIALALLTIPVLALAGQCARIGAPARDRRLAAIRLVGATPRQAITVAAAETGTASAFGVAGGLAAYLVIREVAHRPDAVGRLPLPTDVLPPPWLLAVVCLGIPLLATAVAALLLRRVTVTPFGVIRRVRRRRSPLPWPGALIALGLGAVAAVTPLGEWYARRNQDPPVWLFPVLLLGGGLLASAGVVLGTGWISYTAGRILHRVARRPAALVAARRLLADPWSGSRVFGALLVCVLFGAGAASVRAWFATDLGAQEAGHRRHAELSGDPYIPNDYSFYFESFDLVNLVVLVALVIASAGLLVAVAEGIAARRRAYSALVAAGAPRGTLGRALAWQTLAPMVPAIIIAVSVGALLPRGIATESHSGGYSSSVCDASAAICADPATAAAHTRMIETPGFVVPIPVPYGDHVVVGAVALLAVVTVVGIGALFLRRSVSIEELRVT